MTAEPLPTALPPPASFFPRRDYKPGAALCFVHIAKAAGTSVRLMMENAFPGDQVFPSGSPLSAGRYVDLSEIIESGEDLSRYAALSGHFGTMVGERINERANMFTWLRDPADRAISDFFFSVVQEQKGGSYRPYLERLSAGERAEAVFLDWLAAPPPWYSFLQGMLAGGSQRNILRVMNDGQALTGAALESLRSVFFIGLMEDHERSVDALCALTSILPPKRDEKRNSGVSRPARLYFTPEEQGRMEAVLAPDRAFYALAREIYDLQMAELAERGRTDPALALLGDREGLRRHILQLAASRTPVLDTWRAWDPVLGENLDSREQLAPSGAPPSRWRWTGNSPDTFLYFRLPRRTAFELRIHLAPATPPGHAEQTTLKLSGDPVPMALASTPEGRAELVATVPQSLANRLPELVEIHLHTGLMLDERIVVPYAGTRKLGLAIAEISATPVSPLTMLWRRIGGPRVSRWTRRLLRRLGKS